MHDAPSLKNTVDEALPMAGRRPAQKSPTLGSSYWHRVALAGQDPLAARSTHTPPASKRQGPTPAAHVLQLRTCGVVVVVPVDVLRVVVV